MCRDTACGIRVRRDGPYDGGAVGAGKGEPMGAGRGRRPGEPGTRGFRPGAGATGAAGQA
ncbi:hypothetical protein GCM10018781_66850 [Kitasatospora indigofera]|uniref:Uncharacterized protein n=1 Tax=Kitasatospora indigofera TaxID=67307 RepID=A0A919GE34_9ACTN|nr:hypothetical protein GCM10018781_66850 [Kitasatospora indigofera]